MDNQERIDAAFAALNAHAEHVDHAPMESVEEQAIDLLTDLRHLCDVEDLDFTKLVRISASHFQSEHA
jgi:hypothetical protein